MKTKAIIIDGVTIHCGDDGSISKVDGRTGDYRSSFGGLNHDGYPVIGIAGKMHRIHRLIAMAFIPDFDESLQVDHRNGVRSDNSPSNLRQMTSGQNNRACRKSVSGSSSSYRGVSYYRRNKMWVAVCSMEGANYYLGCYEIESDAARARDAASLAYGFSKESLNFNVRDAQNLLLCALRVAQLNQNLLK